MEYFLMRRDEVITLCNLTDEGQMISYSGRFRNPELLPLQYRAYPDHIRRWWRERQIPLRQGRIEEMLADRGIYEAGDYLLKNLGLSLTDYYWMKPVDSELSWKDVNLFDNDFKENLLQSMDAGGTAKTSSYSPNSSLQGELEKTWTIRNGKRTLIKGNHGDSSAESINEVIATEFHKAQGYDNFTEYRLLRIKGKPYEYGCYSRAFTSNEVELVSAYALLTSEESKGNETDFEKLIRIAAEGGIDEPGLRADLDYQILSDYLLTNVDRHMENIGILRDADSLRFLRMAPIFDTGRAFAAGRVTPYTEQEIDEIEVNSFTRREEDLLKLISDPKVLDPSGILDPAVIETLYHKDRRADEGKIEHITRLYKKKIKRLKKLVYN